MQAINEGNQPTVSQRTSLMVFGAKPKKPTSLKPSDKRKISLLNSDFKIATGIEAARFKKVTTHTLSSNQLVAGENRRIHHGVNLARDAIFAAGKSKVGCGILDTDYVAAFDYLVMHWVFMVLAKKGLSEQVISRLKNLYRDNLTIVVVNNVLGRCFPNHRWSLRQGDVPSMHWFAYAIDPLICFLEKRLHGILIHSLQVLGPCPEGVAGPLPNIEQRYTVIGYADDLKPAVTTMQEFSLVDRASSLFENSSGCRLHRDPKSGKCKFLPLGRWRGSLTQEDIPCAYMVLSDHLDMVGVELKATHTQTRKVNGDALQSRVQNTVGPWRSGRFMPLTQRPWSINSYALSKVWYKCNSVDLRVADISSITSKVKSWLYADQFEKPEELILYRPSTHGGLGMHHVKFKALAILIRSFLETAVNPKFLHNLYHSSLYKYHVLLQQDTPDPGLPPYYSQSFFDTIRKVYENTTMNVATMSSSDWYNLLVEDNCTMHTPENSTRQLIPSRAELAWPENDWSRTWRLARHKGIRSEISTFLWRLLHNILPTQERTSRIVRNSLPQCKLCHDQAVEDQPHALFHCPYNSNASTALFNSISSILPNITSRQILLLDLNLDATYEFSVVWMIGNFFELVWKNRLEKKQVRLYTIRADLEARASLLRETRHSTDLEIISELLQTYFN